MATSVEVANLPITPNMTNPTSTPNSIVTGGSIFLSSKLAENYMKVIDFRKDSVDVERLLGVATSKERTRFILFTSLPGNHTHLLVYASILNAIPSLEATYQRVV
mgnify:CR=1 FL=1